jgi:hypothetical protein
MPTSTSHKRGSGAGSIEPRWGGGGPGGPGDDEGGGGWGGGGGDRLVRVAIAGNVAEGEMIQALLMEEAGIASVLQAASSLPVSYTGSFGGRLVMVAAAESERAKKVLADVWGETEEEQLAKLRGSGSGEVSPARLAFWILAVALGGFLLLWLLTEFS